MLLSSHPGLHDHYWEYRYHRGLYMGMMPPVAETAVEVEIDLKRVPVEYGRMLPDLSDDEKMEDFKLAIEYDELFLVTTYEQDDHSAVLVLENLDWEVRLSQPDDQRFSGRVSFNCRTRRAGLAEAWQTLVSSLKQIGLQILSSRLSRINVAVDMLDTKLYDFLELIEKGHYTCEHAPTFHYPGPVGIPTEMRCGVEERQVRLVDLRQAKASGTEKPIVSRSRLDLFQKLVDCPITRVEFQLLRPALEKMNIHNVEDWVQNRRKVISDGPNALARMLAWKDDGDEFRYDPCSYHLPVLWEVVFVMLEEWLTYIEEHPESEPTYDLALGSEREHNSLLALVPQG